MSPYLPMLTVAALFLMMWWLALSIAVGIAAQKRFNRDGAAWFLIALVFSPLVAFAFLAAFGWNNRGRDTKRRAIVFAACSVVAVLFFLLTSFGHAQQTMVRDAQGRLIGTVSTDSAGTKTFRDGNGRMTGSATRDSGGTTTFRDSQGRMTGSASGPRH
jgi:YD repeat-containing protein